MARWLGCDHWIVSPVLVGSVQSGHSLAGAITGSRTHLTAPVHPVAFPLPAQHVARLRARPLTPADSKPTSSTQLRRSHTSAAGVRACHANYHKPCPWLPGMTSLRMSAGESSQHDHLGLPEAWNLLHNWPMVRRPAVLVSVPLREDTENIFRSQSPLR